MKTVTHLNDLTITVSHPKSLLMQVVVRGNGLTGQSGLCQEYTQLFALVPCDACVLLFLGGLVVDHRYRILTYCSKHLVQLYLCSLSSVCIWIKCLNYYYAKWLTDQKQFFHHLKWNSNAVCVCIYIYSLHISFISVYNLSWPLEYDCPVSALWVFTVIQVCPWGKSTTWKCTGFISMDHMRLQKLTQSHVLANSHFSCCAILFSQWLYICNIKVIC